MHSGLCFLCALLKGSVLSGSACPLCTLLVGIWRCLVLPVFWFLSATPSQTVFHTPPSAEEASAYHATLVSERLSLKPGPGSPAFRSAAAGQRCSAVGGQEGACGTSGDGCCSTERVPASADLRSLLCYSCRLTIRDMSSMERLPPYILAEAECRRSRSQMREEIAEFLLADEEED